MAAEVGDLHVGFVGGGHMAMALAKGFILSKLVRPEHITTSAVTEKTLARWKEIGCKTTQDNTEVPTSSSVVFIAVKPHVVPDVMKQISEKITENHLVISIAGGIPIHIFEKNYRCSRVIRVMPNLACAVQQGASGFACGSGATRADADIVHRLFATVGFVTEVKEPLIDVICAVCGSGTGFVYLVIEAMSDGAVKAGLPRALAKQFATQAVLGAAALVKETGKHPAVLKDETCSAGGTTIAGIHELEKAGFRGALISAVETAANRARELGKQ